MYPALRTALFESVAYKSQIRKICCFFCQMISMISMFFGGVSLANEDVVSRKINQMEIGQWIKWIQPFGHYINPRKTPDKMVINNIFSPTRERKRERKKSINFGHKKNIANDFSSFFFSLAWSLNQINAKNGRWYCDICSCIANIDCVGITTAQYFRQKRLTTANCYFRFNGALI